MAAVANACGLDAPLGGLAFPACGVDDLPRLLRPREVGGMLERAGTVEVVASEERDGRPVFRDLRWGVYVVVEAPTAYAADCFRQYGVTTDATGRYAALYRPSHLIGLELGVSVLRAARDGRPTGTAREFRADAVACAKRDLIPGDRLDGEGGYAAWGRLMPAADLDQGGRAADRPRPTARRFAAPWRRGIRSAGTTSRSTWGAPTWWRGGKWRHRFPPNW